MPPLCRQPAGADELLSETIGNDRVTPNHVVAVHEKAAASWEAVAVRVAEVIPVAGAVMLLRNEATLKFCAASSRIGSAWWPRGSRLDPNGHLSRGLTLRQTAQPETYRFGLGYPKAMFCDTLPVHDGLTMGVLSDKPTTAACRSLSSPKRLGRNGSNSASGTRRESATLAGASNARGASVRSAGAVVAAIR